MDPMILREAVRRFLREDIGRGDITSRMVIPARATASGEFLSKASGVLAGIPAAAVVFAEVDPAIEFKPLLQDGAALEYGLVFALVTGPARSLLAAERLSLNLMQRASGVATATAAAVRAAAPFGAKILDTRKTTPGLRFLEKYAVRIGGGVNHRQGLDDAVLIKDNHIAVAGGVAKAVKVARKGTGPMIKIEVEVDTLEQLAEALEAGAEVILLDNMTPEQMAKAVKLARGRAVLEASGGLGPDDAAKVAATGVDYISMGWLTHSASPLDLSLDLKPTDNGEQE